MRLKYKGSQPGVDNKNASFDGVWGYNINHTDVSTYSEVSVMEYNKITLDSSLPAFA